MTDTRRSRPGVGDTGTATESLDGDNTTVPPAADNLGDVALLHDAVGIQPGDLLSVGRQPAGSDKFFGGKNTARALQTRTYPADENHWAGFNVLHPDTTSSRGKTSDVARVAALVTDLDDKPSGLPDDAMMTAVIGALSELLGTRPVAVIHSGHGRQPVWAIDPDDQHHVVELQNATRRFGALVQTVARLHGGAADSTFDAARVWRIPGSVNVKDPANPVPVTVVMDTGYPLTLTEITAALDAADVPDIDDGDGDVQAAPDTWPVADQPCPYANTMIAAWPTDEPGDSGRHPWLLGQAVRLQAAHRNGCLTSHLKDAGVAALKARFTTMCKDGIGGDKRPPGAMEFANAVTFAIDKASRLTNQQIHDTLGGQPHPHTIAAWTLDGEQPPPGHNTGDDTPDDRILMVGNAATTLASLRTRLGTGATAGIFRRGDQVVNVPRIGEHGYRPPDDGDDGPAQVRPMNATSLAATIDAVFSVRKTDRSGKTVPALVPKSVTERIVAAPEHIGGLRPLRAVTHTPVLRPDWTVIDTPGYCEQTGLLFLPDRALQPHPVPTRPSQQQVRAARDTLLGVIADFPFVTDSDRANYLAAMIAPLVRAALPAGSTLPLLVLNAPMPGSGKSLLAEILMELHGGVFRTRLPDDGAEVRKQITTVLERTTAPVICWDNIVGTIRSADLAALLTSTTWNDRILGESRDVTQPNDRLWVVTGNNVNLGGDMARRGLWVTIDPDQPNPHTRTGFTIGNLRQHVAEHRAELLAALLTLVTGWVAAGRPGTPNRSDTFTGFVTITSGVLAHAGVPGTVMGADTNRADVAADDDQWAVFLGAVHHQLGASPFTVSALVDAMNGRDALGNTTTAAAALIDALPDDLAAKWHTNFGPPINRSLGMWLRNRDGRWAGRYVARSHGRDSHANAVQYVVTTSVGGAA